MEKLFQDLNKIIKKYDNFIIMGHKDPDLDSLGSSLGLYEILEKKGKNAYIVLNHLDEYNTNVKEALNKLKNIKYYKEDLKNKTLLIVVDVHIKDRVECIELLDKYDTLILDHHIKSKNYIKNTIYTYMDSKLSSMSELITFFAEYNNIDLDTTISTILLAGIEIDTNSFNLKTTARTYEAASTLMEMGADSILKQELLKETKEEYLKRVSFIKNSFMATNNTAICVVTVPMDSIELSEISEELLTFQDVEAAFTIGKLKDGKIGVSARSLGNIDVSKYIKQLGGGGHSSNAAVQLENKTIKEVTKEITDILN